MGSNLAGYYPNPFSNPVGQSLPLINLTWPKISINFIIFNNPYKQRYIIPEYLKFLYDLKKRKKTEPENFIASHLSDLRKDWSYIQGWGIVSDNGYLCPYI